MKKYGPLKSTVTTIHFYKKLGPFKLKYKKRFIVINKTQIINLVDK